MSKLFIHIGFHKTGSTAIQYSLSKSEEILKENGYKFLTCNTSGNSSDLISVNLNQSQARVKVTDKFYELIKSNGNFDGIISAEHLSFIEDPAELNKLYEVCSEHYDEIFIVGYIRKQEKLAISFKQQAAKQPHKDASPSSNLCGHNVDTPLPALTYTLAKYLNFSEKLDLWQSVFGENKVEFRLYDRGFLKGGCVCEDFSDVLQLHTKLPSIIVNEGLGVVKSYCKHFLIDSKAPQSLINAFEKLDIKDEDYILEEKELENNIYSHYFCKSNMALPLKKSEVFSLLNTKPLLYLAPKESIAGIIINILKKDKSLEFLNYMELLQGYRFLK